MQDKALTVIFLDIDGVMNTTDSCLQRRSGERFTLRSILSMHWLMRQHPDASVVITSTRRRHGLMAMRRLFERNSLPEVTRRLVGHTPLLVERDIDDFREDEIELWLEANGPAERLVILDDKVIVGPLARHWVEIDSDHGLTMNAARKAALMLKE